MNLNNVKNMSIDINFSVLIMILTQIEEHEVIDDFQYIGAEGHSHLLCTIDGKQIIIASSNAEDEPLSSDAAVAVKDESLQKLAVAFEKIESAVYDGEVFETGGAFHFCGVLDNGSFVFQLEGEEFVAYVDC